MEKLTIERLINSNYVRYNRLVEIVTQAFVGSTANEINIYIDLYSILKGLYSDRSNYIIEDYSSVTSSIINMCAHYREFFRSRYKVESKFYIVYSKNCPYINKQFYPEYNKNNEFKMNSNKIVDDMIKNNLELLSTLCPYLPDIHFIQGTFESGVIIYDLICREEVNNRNPHLVITKDVYNYQLVSMRDNIVILRPKKSEGNDISYYINKSNLYIEYLKSRKADYTNYPVILSPELLSLVMTLSSVRERNIKSLVNIKSTLKILYEKVSNYNMLNGYNSDMSHIYSILGIDKYKIGMTTFEHRFKSIDIAFQHSVFINTPECASISINNLYDPDNVRIINNKYFKNNPLDLNRL